MLYVKSRLPKALPVCKQCQLKPYASLHGMTSVQTDAGMAIQMTFDKEGHML